MDPDCRLRHSPGFECNHVATASLSGKLKPVKVTVVKCMGVTNLPSCCVANDKRCCCPLVITMEVACATEITCHKSHGKQRDKSCHPHNPLHEAQLSDSLSVVGQYSRILYLDQHAGLCQFLCLIALDAEHTLYNCRRVLTR